MMHSHETLNDQLVAMGVRDAFDAKLADFSRMATLKDGNLAISAVLKKTFIDVSKTSAMAAALTARAWLPQRQRLTSPRPERSSWTDPLSTSPSTT